MAVALFAGGGAWLMHATIDPTADAAVGLFSAPVRNPLLDPVRSWSSLTLKGSTEGLAERADLIVVDAAELLSDREPENVANRVAALRRVRDGSTGLVLARVHLTEADERLSYWVSEWAGAPSHSETGPDERSAAAPATGSPTRFEHITALARKAAPAATSVRVWRTPAASAPPWLMNETAERAGRWHVRFHDHGWQTLLVGSPQAVIDRLVASGVDGIVLDGLTSEPMAHGEPQKAPEHVQLMTTFVLKVVKHARELRREFVILLRNAEEFASIPAVRAAIDGLVRENLPSEESAQRDREALDRRKHLLRLLSAARAEGLIVLVSEKARAAQAEVERGRQRLLMHGFVPSLAEPGPPPSPPDGPAIKPDNNG